MVSAVPPWLRRWLSWLPPARAAAAAGLLALLSTGAFAGLVATRDDGRPSGVMALDPTDPETMDLAALLDQQGVLDSDRDGLADAVENLVYGSDPARWNTSGGPLPDGWLARQGADPNDPQAHLRPAATPPAEALPPVYGNRWPDRFTLTLAQAYGFGRPANWSEASQGPFDSGIDARDWDQDDDGIPDGWLVHHGLDPRTPGLGPQRLAGAEGLTVQEAFEHATDPRSLDSDKDGLGDREELLGAANPKPVGPARFPPSDPARRDTAGAGVCDGYLTRHGLDPTDPANSLRDLDRDGAPTREEYLWSANHTAQACTSGGLDPTRQVSGKAGIPDGWLIAYGLDPLQDGVASKATQSAAKDPRPTGTAAPEQDLQLTVRDEYAHGRPPSWSEARDGPWLGGTDPSSNDTDADGLGDAYELAGRRLLVAADPAQPAGATYAAASDPTQADGDADGLLDVEEAQAGTDALRPDTDFDGIADGDEEDLDLGLDPARADSTGQAARAGDLMRDGDRLTLLRERAQQVLDGATYPFPGPPGPPRPPSVWAAPLAGVAKLGASPSVAQLAVLLGPSGDADDDGIVNILDPDLDGDGVTNGPEADPRQYAATRFGLGPLGARSPTDPLAPDTDGDGLRDAWEVEHGILQSGRLTLDPAQWDSDGDCLPPGPACRNDGAEDPDEDGAAWPRFVASGGVPILENVSAPFTNLREQSAGTDPNLASGDGDDLLDGWKAFWGIDYPLLPRTVPSLGLYFPSSIPDTARPVPGTPQREGTASALVLQRPYWRSVPEGATLASEFGESFTGKTTKVERPEGPLIVANVTGTVRLDYQDIQGLGTNPYLADTDGDGLPDWWEHLHNAPLPGMPSAAGCVQGGLDPLRHEPDGDPDGDRLTNVDEFAAGSDPLCRDSDLGGVPDGEEWLRAGGGRLQPARPEDDISLLDDAIDQDLDGAPDFDEITKLFTDYGNPDTDGDGLLDGPSLPQDNGDCWTPLVGPDGADDARARRFLDLGIAYEVRDGCHVFLGERDPLILLDPRDGDDYGVGVPAGWIFMKLAAFNPSSGPQVTSAQNHYLLGRPSWWQEQAHGPWWGGADPDPAFPPLSDIHSSRDLDGDGLRDIDAAGFASEDPFPAGNPGNVPRAVPGVTAATDPGTRMRLPLNAGWPPRRPSPPRRTPSTPATPSPIRPQRRMDAPSPAWSCKAPRPTCARGRPPSSPES